MGIFIRSKTSITQIETTLTGNGYTVKDYSEMVNYSGSKTIISIQVDDIEIPDVEEMENSILTVILMIKHSIDNESDLMDLMESINNLFDDYTLNGNCKSMKLNHYSNGWIDQQRTKNIGLLFYEILV